LVYYETLSRRRVWAPSADQDLSGCPALIFDAREVLTQFATRQMGLSLPQAPSWETRVAAMDVRAPASWPAAGPLAVLDLRQAPRAILGVQLENPRELTVWIMRERADDAEPGRPLVWKSAQAMLVPADVKQLASALEKLLAEGVIVKAADGLRFTGKKPAFKNL
jgi:hypothetical protein